MKKPVWLSKKINFSGCRQMKGILRGLDLVTVCEESLCPNISECFEAGVATFMILGNVCTRSCSFCAVDKGVPDVVDFNEPLRIKEAVEKLNLDYVVITSPTRDDLADKGVNLYCETVKQIMRLGNHIKVEVLIPDFLGKENLIEKISYCGAEAISHNLETVPRLYMKVREAADYNRSLDVLRLIKTTNSKVFTKSGLMLGLGETEEEAMQALVDLKNTKCDFLTLGQYLPPSLMHYPLKEYISPEKFNYFREYALGLGFKKVKSSPYVRSSYLARSFFHTD